jgi:lipopolysaccharide/colanic/teichoic acid biosynthesis glycosyltransferase
MTIRLVQIQKSFEPGQRIKYHTMTKRIFDLVLSLLGLLFLFPILFVISLFIVFDSRGGIFYLQTRVGKDNKDFRLLKFRTMVTGAEKNGLLTIGENDQRITRTGKWLRKYKLDELPQLINILKGEMSFVGPRPEVRKYVEQYTPEQLIVLSVRPGLTDYASIEYMNENEVLSTFSDPEKAYLEKIMPEKLFLNLKYIREQVMITDLKIMIKTIHKIIN